MRRSLSARQRERLAEASRRYWSGLTRQQRIEHRRRSAEGWRAKHPDRAALLDEVKRQLKAGELVPDPCDRCGQADSRPLFDWDAMTVRGWRCADCKRRRD